MITEFDLNSAIAECQGVKNPNAKTCMMLAAYLTIKKELFGEPEKYETPLYSYDTPTKSVETITYTSNTEFSTLIQGRNSDNIWAIIDDLMSILQELNPRLYKSVIRKIKEG